MTNSIWKVISKISLGLIIVLVWAFFWIRADLFFPVNTGVWKQDYILTFIILISFAFAWDTVRGSQTEKALFKVSFLKRFPVFLISAAITGVALFIIGSIIRQDSINTVSQAISQINISIILAHAFLVSIGEELFFRGWIPERVLESGLNQNTAMIVSTIVFALFHAGMGKSVLTLLTYIPLGLLFYQIKRRYSPQTNMANAGAHFAWNIFVLGFLT